jgi:hypothetical protein
LTQHSYKRNGLNINHAPIACSFSDGVPRDSYPGGRFAGASLLP